MTGGDGSIAFFDRMFDETVALLHEARDYALERERAGYAKVHPALQLLVACETLRVTARLTQIMAWLLVQKAVHAGEMTREEARAERNRLGGREVCLADRPWGPIEMPRRLQGLLDRSHGLYARVVRLDEHAERRADLLPLALALAADGAPGPKRPPRKPRPR
jgi:regulator of CtrA degradation